MLDEQPRYSMIERKRACIILVLLNAVVYDTPLGKWHHILM